MYFSSFHKLGFLPSILAAAMNLCAFKGFKAPLKRLGVDMSRFRADLCKNYMAVSITWGSSISWFPV